METQGYGTCMDSVLVSILSQETAVAGVSKSERISKQVQSAGDPPRTICWSTYIPSDHGPHKAPPPEVPPPHSAICGPDCLSQWTLRGNCSQIQKSTCGQTIAADSWAVRRSLLFSTVLTCISISRCTGSSAARDLTAALLQGSSCSPGQSRSFQPLLRPGNF